MPTDFDTVHTAHVHWDCELCRAAPSAEDNHQAEPKMGRDTYRQSYRRCHKTEYKMQAFYSSRSTTEVHVGKEVLTNQSITRTIHKPRMLSYEESRSERH